MKFTREAIGQIVEACAKRGLDVRLLFAAFDYDASGDLDEFEASVPF
jgi:hypothetical protein